MSGLWNETKAWEQGNTGLLKVLVQNRRLPVYHMESGIYYADLAGKSGPGIKSQIWHRPVPGRTESKARQGTGK